VNEVYFSASIKGEQNIDANFGWELVTYIKNLGFKVLSEHVAGRSAQEKQTLFRKNTGVNYLDNSRPYEIVYAEDFKMLDRARYFVGIVDAASIGVGMEIMRCLLKPHLGLNETPTLCLVHANNLNNLSWMVRGITKQHYPNFSLKTYTSMGSAQLIVKEFLLDGANRP
jgi:hypothetical protein